MNWPEAFFCAAAVLGPCGIVIAMILAPERASKRTADEERAKLPGLRAPGEYRVAYTPARRAGNRKGGRS